MPRRFPRTCPVCGRPHLKNLSTHLLKVHGLSSEERRPYLKQAQVSSWATSCQLPPAITEKPREKRVNQCEYLPSAKPSQRLWAPKPYSKFSFPYRFSLLVMDPIQSGKTYFVQQIVLCTKSKEYAHVLELQSMAGMLREFENIAWKKHTV